MKKTSKPNPLKTFNDNKAMAYKKAGGTMSTYKKYLKKAQDGTVVKAGPLTEADTKMLETNPLYKDSNVAYGYVRSGMQPTPKGYRVTPQTMKADKEKEIRSGKNFKKGGAKKALGGVAVDPIKKETRQAMRAINKADRQDKRWNRKDERIQAREQRQQNKENAKILMASKRF
jgi:hypothetical protein